MTEDTQPYEDLMAAIVIQAAGDFVDAYHAGLITNDNKLNMAAVRVAIYDNQKKRCPFPRGMDSTDIQTALSFFFTEGVLEKAIPPDWDIDANGLRNALVRSAKAGRKICSYYGYDKNKRDDY